MTKQVFSNLFFFLILFHSLPSLSMEASDDHDQTWSAVRALAVRADEQLVDALIVSTCTQYGSKFGEQFMTLSSEHVFRYFGARFNTRDHWEDELGYYLGGILGFHGGRYLVTLRHIFTDRVFPQIGSFSRSLASATNRYIVNQTSRFTNWVCSFLSRHENQLNSYSNGKRE